MNKFLKYFIFFVLVLFLGLPILSQAEDKPENFAPAANFEKLSEQEQKDGPELLSGHVYPNWGPVCQRYTYSVIYRDKKGRKPQYIKIYFNGQMVEMKKSNLAETDFQKGVKYIYQYVPSKLGSNFYYFEASNGVGKTRSNIIDSPDNGPVLFESAFDKNEIVLVDSQKAEKIWSFNTGKKWIGGLSMSGDGRYLAAKTTSQILLFDTSTKKAEPKWRYNPNVDILGGDGDVKGGVAISDDGSKIFALLGNQAILFNQKSNQPIWQTDIGASGYNAAISINGNYAAAATAQSDDSKNSNSLVVWQTKNKDPLWRYQASGNFHDVSLSQDGQYLAASTGCPDRRAYFFSINSNQPIIKSDLLTRDSPVHRAKISADGLLAAFGTESDDGAVHLFAKNSKKAEWKFSTPNKSSVRALNITPDGQFIGAATFSGQAYIFSQDSSNPIKTWQIENSRLGAVDIADNGRFLVVGGTDKKITIFEKNSEQKTEITLNEYIGEIDISADGRYIAVGTSGSVYFFESFTDESKVFDCAKVTEPKPEPTSGRFFEQDSLIGGSQTSNIRYFKNFQIGAIIIAGLSFLLLLGFLILVKLQKVKFNKIIFIFTFLVLIFSLYSAGYIFRLQKSISDERAIESRSIKSGEQETKIKQSDESATGDEVKTEDSNKADSAECGNNLCEPDLGESKQNCAKDCSGSN